MPRPDMKLRQFTWWDIISTLVIAILMAGSIGHQIGRTTEVARNASVKQTVFAAVERNDTQTAACALVAWKHNYPIGGQWWKNCVRDELS